MARFFAFRGSSERRWALLTTIEFVVALVAILLGAAFFTNAIEILGGRLGMRQGAVGSLLAAVGTALPESMIAVVAILEPVLTGETSEEGALIGIGAILGAPLMLATLAMFVVGVSALIFPETQGPGHVSAHRCAYHRQGRRVLPRLLYDGRRRRAGRSAVLPEGSRRPR